MHAQGLLASVLLCVGVGDLLPNLPLWYQASYQYDSPEDGISLLMDAFNGDRGVSAPTPVKCGNAPCSRALGDHAAPFLYHTWKLNVRFPQGWIMTAQSIIFHVDGSTAEYTYWSDGPTGDGRDAAGCSTSLAPLGDGQDGVNLDWIAEVPDVAFLGNVTLNTEYVVNATVAHWSSPSLCRDIYLLYPPAPDQPPWDRNYQYPALYQMADMPTEEQRRQGAAACSVRPRTFTYSYFSPMSFYEAGQTSPLWALPPRCAPNSTIPPPPQGLTALQDGYVQTVWLGVGCVLSGLVGAVGALLYSFKRSSSFHVSNMGKRTGWLAMRRASEGNIAGGSLSARLVDVI